MVTDAIANGWAQPDLQGYYLVSTVALCAVEKKDVSVATPAEPCGEKMKCTNSGR